jgi:hypothetical protein
LRIGTAERDAERDAENGGLDWSAVGGPPPVEETGPQLSEVNDVLRALERVLRANSPGRHPLLLCNPKTLQFHHALGDIDPAAARDAKALFCIYLVRERAGASWSEIMGWMEERTGRDRSSIWRSIKGARKKWGADHPDLSHTLLWLKMAERWRANPPEGLESWAREMLAEEAEHQQ